MQYVQIGNGWTVSYNRFVTIVIVGQKQFDAFLVIDSVVWLTHKCCKIPAAQSISSTRILSFCSAAQTIIILKLILFTFPDMLLLLQADGRTQRGSLYYAVILHIYLHPTHF